MNALDFNVTKEKISSWAHKQPFPKDAHIETTKQVENSISSSPDTSQVEGNKAAQKPNNPLTDEGKF